MRQLRIVHTEASLGWGGQEWRVFLELRWMRDRGHKVWLLARRKSEIFARAKEAGIPVVTLNVARLRYPDQVAMMAAFFARHRMDIVNTHSSRDAWMGGLAARLAGVPLIIRSRHIEVDYGWKFLAALGFDYFPHEVLTTSDRIAERIAQECHIPPHKITCIPTGIDLERFTPRGSLPDTALQQELGLPPETPLIGIVSVLRSWKGHLDFLEAVARLRDAGTQARFIIAGDGHFRRNVETRIEELNLGEVVTMLGYREDVPQVLACLSALVLPSTAHEGVPQIVLQAQAVGCPVIGTRVGGIPQVIKHTQTGLKAPPKDPVALAAVMQSVLDDPAAASCRALTAQKLVREEMSLDAMGQRLEQLYFQRL